MGIWADTYSRCLADGMAPLKAERLADRAKGEEEASMAEEQSDYVVTREWAERKANTDDDCTPCAGGAAGIGPRLRAIRQARRLSQAQIAEAMNVPQSSISHFEAGRREPSLQNLRKLAAALSVTLDDLVAPLPPTIATEHPPMSRERFRQAAAIAAMQGLLASGPHDCDEKGIANDALLHADALIAALDRSRG